MWFIFAEIEMDVKSFNKLIGARAHTMKTIELLSVGLRLVGIYGILKGIQNVAIVYASLPVYQAQFPDKSYYFVAGTFVFLYFIAALFLVSFPLRVARMLMPRVTEATSESALKSGDLQVGALTILGVYVIAYSLPLFVQNVAFIWQTMAMPDYYNETSSREYIIYAVARLVELGIGMYLCLQARGLVRLIHKFRELGVK